METIFAGTGEPFDCIDSQISKVLITAVEMYCLCCMLYMSHVLSMLYVVYVYSDLLKGGGFLYVLLLPPPITLTTTL